MSSLRAHRYAPTIRRRLDRLLERLYGYSFERTARPQSKPLYLSGWPLEMFAGRYIFDANSRAYLLSYLSLPRTGPTFCSRVLSLLKSCVYKFADRFFFDANPPNGLLTTLSFRRTRPTVF